MSIRTVTQLLAPVFALCGTALAQTSKLSPVASGATHQIGFYVPHRLALTDKAPAGIKKAPKLSAPLYGTITVRGNPFTVILDRPANGDEKLYVDSNGDGDLTNDPAPTWQAKDYFSRDHLSKFKQHMGTAKVTMALGGETVEASVGIYSFDPTDASRAALKNTLLYYPDFALQGHLNLGGKDYRVMLDDLSATGSFAIEAGKEGASQTLLLIDVNGNGKFDPRGEQYDVSKPFNIGGTTYEVKAIDASGGSIEVVKSTKKVAEILPPPQLTAGNKAIAFAATTTGGKTVTFPGDYRGKVVLLDFWATWCGPCMEEVPNVVKAYSKYHAKGFEILGISLDNEQTAKNIAKVTGEKGMAWPQVCDQKFWSAAVAQLYVVQAIPQAYLVDGDTGIILAEGEELRGDGLDKALDTAFRTKS